MPLPLLAALAGPATALFQYNRANFMYDGGQRLTRTFTSLSYQMQMFQLFRQDIRDLVELTTAKMSNYHVVAALELGISTTMLGPGRLPSDVPDWLLWHQLVCLCGAFVFLVTSMWLSTRAAVAAGSLNVQLQTQWIRLPLPDEEQLDSALTKADAFEERHIDWVRLPFLGTVAKRFCEGPLASPRFSGSPASKRAEASPKPAKDEPKAERNGLPSSAKAKEVEDQNQTKDHLYLYQRLQRRWSCYDAYSRIAMSLGTFWLLMSLGYYEIGWNLCHLEKAFPAIVASSMLCTVVLLLIYIDVHASVAELVVVTMVVLSSPALMVVGVYITDKESGVTPVVVPFVDVLHLALSIWWWHLGRLLPGKDLLPTRWKAVQYLDIFGPIVKELHCLLHQTGLGNHAHHGDDTIEDIRDLFSFVDKDGSGTINREEWNAVFDEIDTNRSGTISRQEWKRHHGQVAIFDVVDGNGNNAISREEWRTAFSSFDRNGDGSISYDEWHGDVEDEQVLNGLSLNGIDHLTERRVKNARARLREAIGTTSGPTRKRRGKLNLAVQIAKIVGMKEDDAQILEAKRALEKLELPKEVRYLQIVLEDWRDGEVYEHLDRRHRADLSEMIETINRVSVRLGMSVSGSKPLTSVSKKGAFAMFSNRPEGQLPVLLRSISDASVANFSSTGDHMPVWTRISPGHGKAAYWVGTPTPKCKAGVCESLPADAHGEEFAVIKAKVVALADRAENSLRRKERVLVANAGQAGPRGSTAMGPGSSYNTIDDDLDFDEEEEEIAPEVAKEKKSRFRRRHHPVVAFKLTSFAMMGVWTVGLVVHALQCLEDTGLLELPRPSRRLSTDTEVAFSLEDVFDDSGDIFGPPRAPSLRGAGEGPPLAPLELPGGFFEPRSFACLPRTAQGERGEPAHHVLVSNGFAVYELTYGLGHVSSRRLECPVDEHESLVSASCSEGPCQAVVIASGALWKCRNASSTHSRSQPWVAAATGHDQSAASLTLWAAVDSDFSAAFAASRSGGPIMEWRKVGSHLHPVGEFGMPLSVPSLITWQFLTVTAKRLLVGIFTSAEHSEPMVAAWSVGSGSFLGMQTLPFGQWGSQALLGWCAGGGSALLGVTRAAGKGIGLRRFPLPSTL